MILLKKLLSIIVVILPIVALSQNCTNLDTLHRIIGKWQQDGDKNITTETWTKLSSNTYDGIAQARSKKDDKITFVETLRLVEMSDDVFYLAKVSHNEFPISFKLTQCSDSTAIFENKIHDFPKKIFYRLSDKGQKLDVTVSNEERQFTVNLRKLTQK
jgi:hypothetical protein